MTKEREANSIEQVLTDVMSTAGLGRARCAEVTGRSISYLLEASDPLKSQLLSAQDMIKLDIAHIAVDGKAPFHDEISIMLARVRADIYVDAAAIARATREVLKEDGEAHLALFAACQPGASDQELRDAIRETTEAAVATTQAIETVRVALEKRRGHPT